MTEPRDAPVVDFDIEIAAVAIRTICYVCAFLRLDVVNPVALEQFSWRNVHGSRLCRVGDDRVEAGEVFERQCGNSRWPIETQRAADLIERDAATLDVINAFPQRADLERPIGDVDEAITGVIGEAVVVHDFTTAKCREAVAPASPPPRQNVRMRSRRPCRRRACASAASFRSAARSASR